MPIDTHSGAVEGFHLLPAIEHAIKDNFDGVQLYINDDILDPIIFEQIVAKLLESNLTNVVFHLPNFDKVKEKPEYIQAVEALVARLPNTVRWHALIHIGYGPKGAEVNVKYSQLQMQIAGRAICIENSLTGVYNTQHVIQAASLARSLGSGFVFDVGRILYPNEKREINEEEVYRFILGVISTMKPETDIIHTAGKLSWEKTFRESACAFGAEGDITFPLRDAILEFHENGGIVVFEHEDQEMILESRRNLLKEQ